MKRTKIWWQAYRAAASGCYASSKDATKDCVATEATEFADRAVQDYEAMLGRQADSAPCETCGTPKFVKGKSRVE